MLARLDVAMKFTSRKSALGVAAVTAALLLSIIVPTAQANTYSSPEAPTNVTSMMGRDGVVVKWTPVPGANPKITGYVVSAGAGSCPIYVHGGKRTGIVMPVVVGQPTGTPFVQAVNAYGFSKPGTSGVTHSAADLAKVASTQNQAVQILQLSDLHGAIEAGTSAFGAAGLASNWDADRAANKATIAISSGDNLFARALFARSLTVFARPVRFIKSAFLITGTIKFPSGKAAAIPKFMFFLLIKIKDKLEWFTFGLISIVQQEFGQGIDVNRIIEQHWFSIKMNNDIHKTLINSW